MAIITWCIVASQKWVIGEIVYYVEIPKKWFPSHSPSTTVIFSSMMLMVWLLSICRIQKSATWMFPANKLFLIFYWWVWLYNLSSANAELIKYCRVRSKLVTDSVKMDSIYADGMFLMMEKSINASIDHVRPQAVGENLSIWSIVLSKIESRIIMLSSSPTMVSKQCIISNPHFQ